VGARETTQREAQSDRATVEGTEWVWTGRGWEAPEDVETEGKVETVAEDRADASTMEELDKIMPPRDWFEVSDEWLEQQQTQNSLTFAEAETEARREQLTTWHTDDQAAQVDGDAEVAL
jgi:hypothetical protein